MVRAISLLALGVIAAMEIMGGSANATTTSPASGLYTYDASARSASTEHVVAGMPVTIGARAAGSRLATSGLILFAQFGVAAKAADDLLPAFPKALAGGPANVHVYHGVRDGKNVYVGLTNDLARRQAQHADRFVLEQITDRAVTRGQARAIEEALILRNPGFENVRHSISPKHAYYRQAVDWGNAWLRRNGY